MTECAESSTAGEAVFEHPIRVRYMEVDAQGVVFNAWYLTYFDEAMAAFLAAHGLSYSALLETGSDTQLVRAEIEWIAGLHWQDEVRVAVSTARMGHTSFALDFQTRRGAEVTSRARIVYVVVALDGSGKQKIPPPLAHALGRPWPLHPPTRQDNPT